jgi:carbon monoxide dehydrogenase subunit G
MAKVNVSRSIPAAADEVWRTISDLPRFAEWLTIHDAFKGPVPSTLTEGATFTEQCTIMGMTNKINWTVTAYDAPHSLQITGSGLAGATISFTLYVAPEGDGSVAAIDAEFTGQMLVGAIGTAVERAATKEITKSLENLGGLAA